MGALTRLRRVTSFEPLSPAFRSRHPNLTDANHVVRSERTTDYNCFAWALGSEDDWLEPGGRRGTSWPKDVDDSGSVESYVALFAQAGYERWEGVTLEDGYEKVAIYGDESEGLHAARQLVNGWWASKLGGLQDIHHETLAALEDVQYGTVRAVLRKARSRASQLDTLTTSDA
jgi:hypothetical protein